MSDAAAAWDAPEAAAGSDPDQRVILYGVDWEGYEAVLRAVGADRGGVRVTYLEGALEIMTLSGGHEVHKKILARLLEAWAVETRTVLNGYGSTTYRKRVKDRGAEPDESYVLSDRVLDETKGDAPDLVIEVIWTHGGLDKLAVYSGLGVPEVWLWRKGRVDVYRLRGERYEKLERSELLPDVDLDVLTPFLDRSDQTQAVIEYVDALRERSGRQP
jgi:Uma2 family endonuclease